MKDILNNENIVGIAVIIYGIIGMCAVAYVKSNILGVESEYTTSLFRYYALQFIWGILLGWLAIPVALIHCIFANRD